uniref:NADH-ubiquinone oxidoreductase chain 2 n=1 Tax=Trypodendron domesticum TaxID=1220309 RepID=A0A343A6D2_9CUCU|nr:NADH dehydrogenase subunit 2 [Trypodendron domesticum]AOY40111.1 NADH dehydrogenase subunit 2 [Trypodendron domesticum]
MYKLLFFFTLTAGTFLSISASSWIIAWIGLEVNLLSFLPLMKKSNIYSSEAAIKYFLTQTMASMILILSLIIFTNKKNFSENLNLVTSLILQVALLLKMGAAPLHFWFPEVISGLDWMMSLILLTWQKIAPMMLLSYSMNSFLLTIVAIISSFTGSILGFNQTCLRKILAYSSINHIGWMIMALMNSVYAWLSYFLIYILMNLNIILMFKTSQTLFFSQLMSFYSNNSMKLFFMFNFISLGGLPPFLGFLPKWVTINSMMYTLGYFPATLIILATLITLYFYLRIIFLSLTLTSLTKTSILNLPKMSFMLAFNNFLVLMSMMSLLSITLLV